MEVTRGIDYNAIYLQQHLIENMLNKKFNFMTWANDNGWDLLEKA